MAQTIEPTLEDGKLIYKNVYTYDGVTQSQLYMRAHTFLSDWVGPNKNCKSSIEFDDKESATIISKGSVYNGYFKENMMYGWDVYIDYTLTIRCKDGRVQVIIKVPSMSFHWTANNTPDITAPIEDIYPEYDKSKKYLCRLVIPKATPEIPAMMALISETVKEQMSKVEDDDF